MAFFINSATGGHPGFRWFLKLKNMAYTVKMVEFITSVEIEGSEHQIKVISPILTDTITGEKAGCTDPLAMNYCEDCTVSTDTCLYLAQT